MLSMQYITSSAPQGSVVGPLFFRICINDILRCTCTREFNCMLYADDTTLSLKFDCFGKKIHIVGQNISTELQKIGK